MVFLYETKTLATKAMRTTFSGNHPNEDFRGIKVGIEYPSEQQHYPSIWVGFTPPDKLKKVGLGHHELTPPGDGGARNRYTRFRGEGGTISYTVVAMTSLERDRLHDEVLRVLTFSDEEPELSAFYHTFKNNDLLAIDLSTDAIYTGGVADTPGTPWGTLEIIYEATLSIECAFEFVSDPTGALQPISQVQIVPFAVGQEDPEPDGDGHGTWL